MGLIALRAKGYQVSERGKLPRIRNQRTESAMLPRMPEHGEALEKAKGGTDEKFITKPPRNPSPHSSPAKLYF